MFPSRRSLRAGPISYASVALHAALSCTCSACQERAPHVKALEDACGKLRELLKDCMDLDVHATIYHLLQSHGWIEVGAVQCMPGRPRLAESGTLSAALIRPLIAPMDPWVQSCMFLKVTSFGKILPMILFREVWPAQHWS